MQRGLSPASCLNSGKTWALKQWSIQHISDTEDHQWQHGAFECHLRRAPSVVVNWPFLKEVHSTQIKPRLWLSLRGSITAAGEEKGTEASENTKEPEDWGLETILWQSQGFTLTLYWSELNSWPYLASEKSGRESFILKQRKEEVSNERKIADITTQDERHCLVIKI